jgi:altronate dehydratase large subunit
MPTMSRATASPSSRCRCRRRTRDALALVDAGVRAATKLVHDASFLRRERCEIKDLCIAVECGHADTSSGLVCNPLAGRMMEAIVSGRRPGGLQRDDRVGGRGALLVARAETPDVARRIEDAVRARERMVREAGGDWRAQNPGPQNIAGGITTIEEKAMGAIAKGGRQAIRACWSRRSGRRAGSVPHGHAILLAGIHDGDDRGRRADRDLHDGCRNSYCSLVAPTFKMSANRATAERLGAQIDFAAPGVMDRSMTLDAAARDAMDRLLAVASGALTFGEIVGEGTEVVSRLGASV